MNKLLDAEADQLCNAARYERTAARKDTRAGYYNRGCRIRTNNPLERIMREIRRRTNLVGAFPDGNSALMLVAVRLRHIAGTRWSTKRYLNMDLLQEMELEQNLQVA